MVIEKYPNARTSRARKQVSAFLCGLAASSVALSAPSVEVPEIPIVAVAPGVGDAAALVPEWEPPRRPAPLSGRERQAVLQQVAGGGQGGVPLLNTIQTQGKTPTVRHLLLTVKRPWYVHRGFLSGENVQRVDARSNMRFDESVPGRAIVGLNLVKDSVYLLDFLIDGEGLGGYTVRTSAGDHAFPDPDGKRTHVLIALKAEKNGWTEVSLSRDAGAFNLHSVEVTLVEEPAGEG